MWFHNVLNHPNWPRNPLRPLRRRLVHWYTTGWALMTLTASFNKSLSWLELQSSSSTGPDALSIRQLNLRQLNLNTKLFRDFSEDVSTIGRFDYEKIERWTFEPNTQRRIKTNDQPTINRPINPLSRHFAFRAGWVFLTDGWCCSHWCDGVASIAPRLKNGWGHLWSPTPPEDDDNEDWRKHLHSDMTTRAFVKGAGEPNDPED